MTPAPDDPSMPQLPPLFAQAGATWSEQGRPNPLIRQLERLLGSTDGLPATGDPSSWWHLLEALSAWRQTRPSDWPERLDQLAGLLLKNALRFSRTDGSPVFGPEGEPARRADLVRTWTDRIADPSLATVAHWWFPTRRRSGRSAPASSPPLPAVASETRVLAMLRPDWRAEGDLLAVHQPSGSSGSRIELRAGGRRLIGPDWPFSIPDALSTSPRRLLWSSLSRADALQWSLRAGPERISRTAILFRGAGLALLAEQRKPIGPRSSVSLPVAPGVSASLGAGEAFAVLRAPGLKAQVIPLAPTTDLPNRLSLDGSSLVLDTASPGKRLWTGWLVVWDQSRTRRTPVVRPLTVTSRTARCPSDMAQAYRIAWGTGFDSLVLYRSLARPDLRTFLGQQTTAEFLAGWFDTSGNLAPLVTFPV